MNILLTCATSAEAKPLRHLLSREFPVQQKNGIWTWDAGGNQIQLIRTGISVERAGRVLTDLAIPPSATEPTVGHQKAEGRKQNAEASSTRNLELGARNSKVIPQAVVVFGMAGQLDPEAPVGAILIPHIWRSELSERSLQCSALLLDAASQIGAAAPSTEKLQAFRVGVTLRQAAWSMAERRSVRQRYPDATVCDMETFVVMEKFPHADCVSIRIVSDDGSEEAVSAYRSTGKTPQHPMCAVVPGLNKHCARLAKFVYEFLEVLED